MNPPPTARKRQTHIEDALRAAELAERQTWEAYTRELRATLRSIDPAAVGLTPRAWEAARELAMAVASYAYHDRNKRCQQDAATLLETARRGTPLIKSIDQLYRARRDLLKIGALAKCYGYDADGNRTADLVWLDADRLAELVETTRTQRRQKSNQLQPVATSCNQLQPVATTYKETINPKALQNHSSSNQAPATQKPVAAGDAAAWEAIEEELFLSCGMHEAKKACRAAQRNGASAADVVALVEFWKPRRDAWRPYAVPELFHRIQRAAPGGDPAAHWPPPRPGWKDGAAVAGELARLETRRTEAAAARAARDEDDRRAALLEAEHGPDLEQLTDDELAELLAGDAGAVYALRRLGRNAPLARRYALTALAARMEPHCISTSTTPSPRNGCATCGPPRT